MSCDRINTEILTENLGTLSNFQETHCVQSNNFSIMNPEASNISDANILIQNVIFSSM